MEERMPSLGSEGISMGGFQLHSVCPDLNLQKHTYNYILEWGFAEVIGDVDLQLQLFSCEDDEEDGFYPVDY